MMKTILNIFSNIQRSHINMKDKLRLSLRVISGMPYQVKLQRMFENSGFASIPKNNPRHYYRFALPYLCSGLSHDNKLQYLTEHYQVLQRFSEESQRNMYAQSMVIADFSHVNQPLLFNMGYVEQFEKEGEITFFLSHKTDGNIVYALTGIFTQAGFKIGGFQGQKNIDKMRTLTKSCHGMRPHNFLFSCVTEFVRAMGYDTIYGVSNDHHIYKSHKKTEERIQFDYNQFWADFTPQAIASEIWVAMSCRYPRKEMEQIISKKRAMYRKRYEMLDCISTDIEGFVQTHVTA